MSVQTQANDTSKSADVGTTTAKGTGGDIAALTQEFFEQSINEINSSRKKYSVEANLRRFAAYALKAISIFGAIIVAAKLQWVPQTLLGIVIAAAVGLDQLTSNHSRLVTMAAAQHACERLAFKIKAEHVKRLPEVLKIRGTVADLEFNTKLTELLSELTTQANTEIAKIADNVRDADLKALNNLYVDVKKS